jgi:hypothetical protein
LPFFEAGQANFHLLTAVLAKDVHRVSVALPKKRVWAPTGKMLLVLVVVMMMMMMFIYVFYYCLY